MKKYEQKYAQYEKIIISFKFLKYFKILNKIFLLRRILDKC